MIPKTNRIDSIDILRGVVMVIMALDHVRDYFHYGSFSGDPTNLETTNAVLFFTRFITHYCAPVFVFLAGTSAFLYAQNKTKSQLFRFLLSRGIWLILLEIIVNNLIWTFDLTYSFQIFQVIWAIGFSMVCLSFLIYLPKKFILIIGIVLIVGHNLLDGFVMEGQSLRDIIWYALHQQSVLVLNPNHVVIIQYPVIPWIGVMALGYLFGTFYKKDFDEMVRGKWLLILGFMALFLFFILRGVNMYGDLVPWTLQETAAKTVLSIFNVSKYPPSLLYLCITLGPAFLFLYAFENIKNKVTDFFLVFGRVPLFYYFLHVFVIHLFALIAIFISGDDWHLMILDAENFLNADFSNYGYPLWVVYTIWIGVVLLLYPFCKKYMVYKTKNKSKLWLSYL